MSKPKKKDSKRRKPAHPKAKAVEDTPPLSEEDEEMIAFVANSMGIEGFNCDRARLIREAREMGLIGGDKE
jgi:hypothetical protein